MNIASLQTDTHVFTIFISFILSFIFIYYLSTIIIFSFALNLRTPATFTLYTFPILLILISQRMYLP